MFQSLFRRAEVAIEQSIGQLLVRAITAVPFIIAFAYGASALSVRLDRMYDPETSRLIMAGLFLALGVLATLIVAVRAPRTSGAAAAETGGADPAGSRTTEEARDASKTMADADRELIYAALTSAAPIALPHLARLLLRNLPLVVALAGALFVMTRPAAQQSPAAAPAE